MQNKILIGIDSFCEDPVIGYIIVAHFRLKHSSFDEEIVVFFIAVEFYALLLCVWAKQWQNPYSLACIRYLLSTIEHLLDVAL